tara:strand:+ start:3791 stop:4081 length:291 start_codon:yes stop_codon:yes gene_type:complete
MDKKKNFIYNAMYLEYLHETTATIVKAKFGDNTFLDKTDEDKGFTDDALVYYSDVHEEVEGMVNQMLNTYSDEELWEGRRKEIETLTLKESNNELN